jgi:hypothetical protein
LIFTAIPAGFVAWRLVLGNAAGGCGENRKPVLTEMQKMISDEVDEALFSCG